MKKSITCFTIFTFVFSWPFGIYGYGWFDGNEILYRYIFASLFMMGPAVAAFVVRYFIEKKNFKDFGHKVGNYKIYILVFFMFSMRFIAPSIIDLFTGNAIIREDITNQMQIVISVSLFVGIISGFGEEFGWRGYLLPRLLEKHDKLTALIVIGVIWGFWHFPIALGGLTKTAFEYGLNSPEIRAQIIPTLVECGTMIGASIAMSIIFGALWLKSNSILLVSFAHAWHNASRDIISILFKGTSIFSVILGALVFGLILLGAFRWLKKDMSMSKCDSSLV